MRFTPAVLALSVLAAAEQVPILDQVKGWFAKASSTASSYVPSSTVPSIPNPVDSGAGFVADAVVDRVTLNNHKDILRPGAATSSPDLEEWMLFTTGANKTCFGLCKHSETEWNKSVPLLMASKNPPHLAILDCETDGVLCNAWAVGPPTIIHMFLPQPLPDQSTPASTVRFIGLNRTSVTAEEIAAIHIQEIYKKREPYEGIWHPFDGALAKAGVNIPFGWLIWGFSAVPSWAFMVLISFGSRTIMNRRMPQERRAPSDAPPAAART